MEKIIMKNVEMANTVASNLNVFLNAKTEGTDVIINNSDRAVNFNVMCKTDKDRVDLSKKMLSRFLATK
jgi:hypothetical protein